MKKPTPRKKTSKVSPSTRPADFNEYLAVAPQASRDALLKLRAAIRSAVPKEAIEVISYGIPAFKENGILVWFAGFADHCSLFPKASVIAAFQPELKGLKTAKGTIQFPLDKPLPLALIKKIVKARVVEAKASKSR
jgi:uncharacterized protein YdhG (YjbR/CyaY superfamily)